MFDTTGIEACVGLWCMYREANTMVNGWLSIAVVVSLYAIVFIVKVMQGETDYKGAFIIANFASSVLGFLLWLGHAWKFEYLIATSVLLFLSLIIKKLTE